MIIDFNLLNDYELIYLYKEGNEKAFDILLEKYSRIIAKFIIPKVDNKYVNDIVQDASILFYRCIMCFDENKGSFFSYFFKAFINYYSKESKKIKFYESFIFTQDESIFIDESNLVIKGFKYLNNDIEICIFDEIIMKGMSISEFCSLYNLSYYKVKIIYNRLINKLKRIID